MSYLSLPWTAVKTCVVALLLTSVISAQSDYGSITGFVKDPSGLVVPNAKVIVRNEGNGEQHSILTNEFGYFVVPNLQLGYYNITAEASGFKKFVSSRNKLNPNSALALPASLTIGSSTETVEVSASKDAIILLCVSRNKRIHSTGTFKT